MKRVKVIGLVLFLMVVLIGCGNGDDVVGLNGDDIDPMFEPGEVAVSDGPGVGTIVWDIETGEVLYERETHISRTGTEFSPCGSKIIGGGSEMEVWDLEKDEIIMESSADEIRIRYSAVSPCGNIILTPSNERISMWDSETGEKIRAIEDVTTTQPLGDPEFSPSGDRFMVSNVDFDRITVWDRTGEKLVEFEEHGALADTRTNTVAFSPCGEKIMSADYDGSGKIRLWDSETGEVLRKFDYHSEVLRAVEFSPCGEVAASSCRDSLAKVWEIESKETISSFDIGQGELLEMEFTPCQEKIVSLYSGSEDPDRIKVWEVETGNLLYEIDDFERYAEIHGISVYQGVPGE